VKLQSNEHEQAYKDPVCGMEINRETANEKFVYHGKTFYFCAESCQKAFKAEPEKYIHQQH